MASKLVLCSHGRCAEGLLEAARMIAGGMEDVASYQLMPGMSPEQYRAELAEGFAALEDEGVDEIICLVDLFGGTPSNSCLALMRDHPITVVTGLNLAMLIETYCMLRAGMENLADAALATLKESGRVIRLSDFE